MVYIMQDFRNGALLKHGQRDGGILPESGRGKVFIKLEELCVNLCFQSHMPAVVLAVFFFEFCFPVNVRVAVGVQGIVAKEAGNVGFCDFLFLPGLE